MAYYRAMYKKVVFIVATDEPKFAMRSVPNKFGDVYYTSHKQDVSNPIAFDMAAISLCNHTIISVGTFSFWGSYLSGGMVVAPSRYQGDDPGRYDLEIKHWDRQQEWFSWS
ncbi:Galactoside 2-alpha-L-fucosyltransferase 1 [Amphibalanus amphitrite]|nr:Galactoside 2-alpha-L-fucosyltransferase 1 [Amphibalanus amphitrite]